MSKFWIIALDVYKKNVKSISFLILVLMPFLFMGIMYVAGSFAGGMSDVNTIGVVSNEPALAEQFASLESDEYKFEVVDSEDAAQKDLKNEDIDAYLMIDMDATSVVGKIYSGTSLGNTTEMTIQQMLTMVQTNLRSSQLNLTAEEVASLNEPASFETQKVSFDGDKMEIGEDNSGVQYIISFVVTIILFVFIITYSQIIAQEIASEKGTRIMEVLLSSTRAQTHFYGKVVGILLVALTQGVIYAVAIGIGYTQFKDMDMVKGFLSNVSLQAILGPFIVYTILYILIGIFIYAVLSALCGSLVNKAEDTAKAVQPVLYLSMIGYMIGIIMGAADPNNIVIRVASYIPFISSYIMPIRLANETVGTGGVLISLGILLVSSIALTLFSATLYKSNVLVYSEGGVFSSLKQSISIMQNERKKKA